MPRSIVHPTLANLTAALKPTDHVETCAHCARDIAASKFALPHLHAERCAYRLSRTTTNTVIRGDADIVFVSGLVLPCR